MMNHNGPYDPPPPYNPNALPPQHMAPTGMPYQMDSSMVPYPQAQPGFDMNKPSSGYYAGAPLVSQPPGMPPVGYPQQYYGSQGYPPQPQGYPQAQPYGYGAMPPQTVYVTQPAQQQADDGCLKCCLGSCCLTWLCCALGDCGD